MSVMARKWKQVWSCFCWELLLHLFIELVSENYSKQLEMLFPPNTEDLHC